MRKCELLPHPIILPQPITNKKHVFLLKHLTTLMLKSFLQLFELDHLKQDFATVTSSHFILLLLLPVTLKEGKISFKNSKTKILINLHLPKLSSGEFSIFWKHGTKKFNSLKILYFRMRMKLTYQGEEVN